MKNVPNHLSATPFRDMYIGEGSSLQSGKIPAHIQTSPTTILARFGKPWAVNWAMAVSCLQELGFYARQQGMAISRLKLTPHLSNDPTHCYTLALDHSTQLNTLLVAALKPLWREASDSLSTQTEWILELDLVTITAQAAEWGITDYHPTEAEYAPEQISLQLAQDRFWERFGVKSVGLVVAMGDVDPYRLMG